MEELVMNGISRISKEYLQLKDKNTVFSPYSFLCLMALIMNMVKENTFKEINKSIFKRMTLNEINDCFIYFEKNSEIKSTNVIGIHEENKKQVIESIKEIIELYHVNILDLNKDIINDYAKLMTNGMINSLIDELSDDTLMYLANIITFDKKWLISYEESQIIDGIFINFKDDIQSCKMLTSREYGIIDNDYYDGFIKYYKGYRYAFIGLLPKKKGKVAFNNALNHLDVMNLYHEIHDEKVDVIFPEFKCADEYDLKEYCINSGINELFTSNAQFTFNKEIYVSDMKQKAFIEVNASGTKAVATSSVVVAVGCFDPFTVKTIELNRPFVYAIIDTANNGLPLFVGKVIEME